MIDKPYLPIDFASVKACVGVVPLIIKLVHNFIRMAPAFCAHMAESKESAHTSSTLCGKTVRCKKAVSVDIRFIIAHYKKIWNIF